MQVPQHRLRHVPLFPTNFNPAPGLRVEGYLHDCWWPGEVVEQHYRKGWRVCFDDGDTAWLVRRNVRPMLRRASQPIPVANTRASSHDKDGASSSGGGGGGAVLSIDLGTNSTPPMPRLPIRFPYELNPHEAIDALRSILADKDWATLRLSEVQRLLESHLLPDQPSGWLGERQYALVSALEHVLAANLKQRPPKRTKHRLLSATASRSPSAKRSKGSAPREQLLCKPLLCALERPTSAPAPTLVAFVRATGKQAESLEDAVYILQCIGGQMLATLTYEQLVLYNAPPPYMPPLPPPSLPPRTTSNATAAAGSVEGAAAGISSSGVGEAAESIDTVASSVDAAAAVAAVAAAEEDDGTVRIDVCADGPGWRRVCDMCSASIFNVYLRADGRGSIDGSDNYELCVDCWAAAMRGAAAWPIAADDQCSLDALCFRAHCEWHPGLMVEMSRRVQAALTAEQLQQAASAVSCRPPLGPPLTESALIALRQSEPPPIDPAILLRLQLGAGRQAGGDGGGGGGGAGGRAAAAAGQLKRQSTDGKAKPPASGGGSGAARKAGSNENAPDELELEPAPEFGPGWRRETSRRVDSIGRAMGAHWIAPDGRRFNARAKVLRFLKTPEGLALQALSGAPAAVDDESSDDETVWVECERCGKWRHLPPRTEPLPPQWYCEMSDDLERNTCEAPEETWEEDEDWEEGHRVPDPPPAAPKPDPKNGKGKVAKDASKPKDQSLPASGPLVDSFEACRLAIREVADCAVCKFCLDKTKYGGHNSLKQQCQRKQTLLKKLRAKEVSSTREIHALAVAMAEEDSGAADASEALASMVHASAEEPAGGAAVSAEEASMVEAAAPLQVKPEPVESALPAPTPGEPVLKPDSVLVQSQIQPQLAIAVAPPTQNGHATTSIDAAEAAKLDVVLQPPLLAAAAPGKRSSEAAMGVEHTAAVPPPKAARLAETAPVSADATQIVSDPEIVQDAARGAAAPALAAKTEPAAATAPAAAAKASAPRVRPSGKAASTPAAPLVSAPQRIRMARRMGEEAWAKDAHLGQSFRSSFGQGQPVVVGGVHRRLRQAWTPDEFSRMQGAMPVSLLEVAAGEQAVFDGYTLSDFFAGFTDLHRRPLPPRHKAAAAAASSAAALAVAASEFGLRRAPAAAVGMAELSAAPVDPLPPPLLKLRDWPSDRGFREVLPDHFTDLMGALPLGAYTRLDGTFNLASFLPETAVPPDLGPKCYCAYGELGAAVVGTTSLHVDMADAVNVIVHVHGFSDDAAAEARVSGADPVGTADEGAGSGAAATANGGEGVCELYGQQVLPSHGAVWHVFSQPDTKLLQSMLPYFVRQRGVREGNRELLDSTHALLDGAMYLDDELLATLREQAGIVPFVILQRLGDAVLVPAGCAHQVRNLRSCIKVAADFVAPEHVAHCVRLTEELRQLPEWHHRRQDVLSIRAILFYSACACVSAFEENKRREDAKREKQRRLDRKSTLSFEAPTNSAIALTAASAVVAVPPAATPKSSVTTAEAVGTASLALGEQVAAALML